MQKASSGSSEHRVAGLACHRHPSAFHSPRGRCADNLTESKRQWEAIVLHCGVLDFSPQYWWSCTQNPSRSRRSVRHAFQSQPTLFISLMLQNRDDGFFPHSPMEFAICDCLVRGERLRHHVKHLVFLNTQRYWWAQYIHLMAETILDPICKYWVLNFKCNVYENQSEPCILLNIYFF